MRKIFFVLMSVAALTMSAEVKVSSGRIVEYPHFKSEYVEPRDVFVWLPDGYTPEQKYDVIYMHDGQMLFDATNTWNHQEWQVDEVMKALNDRDLIRPAIVVGMANIEPSRYGDYFPAKALEYLPEGTARPEGVKYDADNYLKFLVKEVKPFIDKNYSTNPDSNNTSVLGSSMGGLISLYALCEYPETFGGAACLSTHTPLVLEMDNPATTEIWAKAFREYLKEKLPQANSAKIYMDRGDRTVDALYPVYQSELDALMTTLGWTTPQWVSNVYPGAAHDENDWAARLRYPITFLVGK